MKFIIYFCLIVFGLSSCVREGRTDMNIPDYARHVESREIKGQSAMNGISSDLRHPGQLWILGDSIAVIDVYDGHIYTLFSISGDSIISRFGRHGHGPNELMRPSFLQVDSSRQIYIYDEGRQLIHHTDYENLTENLDILPPVQIKEMSGGFLDRTVTGYVGDKIYGDGSMFTFFDSEGNPKVNFGVIPDTDTGNNLDPDFYMANQVEFVVSPDRRHMCAFGFYHDWLAFFDVSGDHPELIKEYFSSHPEVNTEGKDDRYHLHANSRTKIHFWSAAPFDDGVYVNYIGATQENFDKNIYQNTILKCDWNGDIKRSYEIDEQIGSIASDKNGRTIYGIAINPVDETKQIFRYNLK